MVPVGIINKNEEMTSFKEKQSIISQMAELAKVDGILTEDEVQFIRSIGHMMGFDDEQITSLIKDPVPFDPPAQEGDRIVQLQRLILLMNVDGESSPEEKEHIRHAGVLLGLNPDAIKEVLHIMHEFPNNVIPPDELIKIFQKHHN